MESPAARRIRYNTLQRLVLKCVSFEEVPDGPKNIGLSFRYRDTVFKQDFTDYMIIRAETEKQAMDYYRTHYEGKHFSFSPGKIEPDGKCVYGAIRDTYYAACPGFHADATAAAGSGR